MKAAGIVLLIAGLLVMGFGLIGWTEHKTLLDIGPIEAHSSEQKTSPQMAIVGGIAAAAGLVLLVSGGSRRLV